MRVAQGEPGRASAAQLFSFQRHAAEFRRPRSDAVNEAQGGPGYAGAGAGAGAAGG